MAVYNVLTTEVILTKGFNESFKELRSREVDKHLELLINQFRGNENFNFNRKSLTNNLCKIVENMRLLTKNKRGKIDKQTLETYFRKKNGFNWHQKRKLNIVYLNAMAAWVILD